MMFEHTKTERAEAKYAGIDFKSDIRIVMRSPEAVLFVGYGMQLHYPRQHMTSVAVKQLASAANAVTLNVEATRAAIIKAFGEGSVEEAIKAVKNKGKGTVLVNGGGDPLPLPARVRRDRQRREWEAITPTTSVLGELERCLCCNTPLSPKAEWHSLARHERISTIEECQRRTNAQVVGLRGYDAVHDRELWPYAEYYLTWDGETYKDPHFCNSICAAKWGREQAAMLHPRI
jgi:hypothetical protein